ncbi:MAG: PASTA domain-containing protein [Bacteroidota bacterium]
MLNVYTRHNTSIVVPDFKGISLDKIEDFASDNGLDYMIIDSIYDYSLAKGTVALQDPLPGTKVKKNRKIYLTVVALNPEQVSMPNLNDLTLRQASAMLETYGLKIGNLTYIPDIAHNAVLHQKYKGAEIKEGVLIEKGSEIDLVLGKGEENETSHVPDLIGKKQGQALELLQEASLNMGNEIFLDGNDTTSSKIYKQNPSPNSTIQFGGVVDVWYRSAKKFDFSKIKK